MVAQLLSRAYAVTKGFDVSKVSGYGWSVTVEVLHYLVSLVGVSFFSGDIVIPAGS
jgi:hypothetical protein